MERMNRHAASARGLDKLLAPNTTSDWLDRRAWLEQPKRREALDATVMAFLKQHHPRFGGQA